jgi:hypothetical protein
MKIIRMSFILASLVGAASLFLVVPVSMSATSDMGWEVFYTGDSEPITTESSSYQSAAGQGFDLFNSGDGVKVEDFAPAYRGTSMGSDASSGWDPFRAGDGDPLP